MSEDLPKSVESDDQKFFELMDLQDPDGIAGFEEEAASSLEEKYERQITMEKVIQPMLDRIFDKAENPEWPDVKE